MYREEQEPPQEQQRTINLPPHVVAAMQQAKAAQGNGGPPPPPPPPQAQQPKPQQQQGGQGKQGGNDKPQQPRPQPQQNAQAKQQHNDNRPQGPVPAPAGNGFGSNKGMMNKVSSSRNVGKLLGFLGNALESRKKFTAFITAIGCYIFSFIVCANLLRLSAGDNIIFGWTLGGFGSALFTFFVNSVQMAFRDADDPTWDTWFMGIFCYATEIGATEIGLFVARGEFTGHPNMLWISNVVLGVFGFLLPFAPEALLDYITSNKLNMFGKRAGAAARR